ncbi:MAG: hypothetical protein KKB25_02905 [Nanoarchaeota archaeon]|nr:hypothetical protein [Nanoarchaeota archaeon]
MNEDVTVKILEILRDIRERLKSVEERQSGLSSVLNALEARINGVGAGKYAGASEPGDRNVEFVQSKNEPGEIELIDKENLAGMIEENFRKIDRSVSDAEERIMDAIDEIKNRQNSHQF